MNLRELKTELGRLTKDQLDQVACFANDMDILFPINHVDIVEKDTEFLDDWYNGDISDPLPNGSKNNDMGNFIRKGRIILTL